MRTPHRPAGHYTVLTENGIVRAVTGWAVDVESVCDQHEVMSARQTETRCTALLDELSALRAEISPRTHQRQKQIIAELCDIRIDNLKLLKRLHEAACGQRACAESDELFSAAEAMLRGFPARIRRLRAAQRRALKDTGLAGTALHFEFSCDVACWLVRRFARDVDIAWADFQDPERLDSLLAHFVMPAEQQTWDDGEVSTREWVRAAKGAAQLTDLAWIAQHVESDPGRRRIWAALYDAAEVPLRWHLGSACGSITFNEVPWLGTSATRGAWRRPPEDLPGEIQRPFASFERLDVRRAADIIDVSRAALAARHREVYAMTYANPKEIYLADAGCGVHIAILGVLPDRRLSLEGNYGYMILSRGRPVGYGGASPLFAQANTGINIFDDFRKGESAYLFVQVLRAWHHLFDSRRFIANPFQFGAGNSEALASGAFWFYHKLGFRPVDPAVRRMADDCAAKRKRQPDFKADRATMQRLCSGNLELCLPGAEKRERFSEHWLGVLAMEATKLLAAQGPVERKRAVRAITMRVAANLGVRPSDGSRAERTAFADLSPLIGLVPDLAAWSRADKAACVRIMRAKGADQERGYVKALANHTRLQSALAAIGDKFSQ